MIFNDEDMKKMAEWLLSRYTRRLVDHEVIRDGHELFRLRVQAAAQDAMHMLDEKLRGEAVNDRFYAFIGPIR